MVQKLKPNAQKILNDIKDKKIFLLDGATGTYLQNHGLEPGGCPELMNKENPKIIASMADIYFKNGFSEIEAKAGIHFGTYKVFVNFIPVADIIGYPSS